MNPVEKENFIINFFNGKSISVSLTPIYENDHVSLYDPFSYLSYIYFTVTLNKIERILISSNVDESLFDVLKFGTTHGSCKLNLPSCMIDMDLIYN